MFLCRCLFACQSLDLELSFFFFNDPAPTEIYTLSLHDALPILQNWWGRDDWPDLLGMSTQERVKDRKSTRLNSSHLGISYAVFCLKKKKTTFQAQCISTPPSSPSA